MEPQKLFFTPTQPPKFHLTGCVGTGISVILTSFLYLDQSICPLPKKPSLKEVVSHSPILQLLFSVLS